MSDDIDDLIEAIRVLRRDHEAHVVKTQNMLRVGPVVDRDHAKGMRIEHGTDEAPDQSAWVQPSERSGVERDVGRKGEQYMVLAPYGLSEIGIAIPHGHSKANPNPAGDVDEVVLFNRDGFKIFLKDKVATLVLGKTSIKMSEQGLKLEHDGKTYDLNGEGHALAGGKVSHEKRNIGAGHIHSGVLQGGGKTQPPDE